MEKLSVIVPVYNTYPYLRQCLESIINQSYKNLEIIIVNDASPYKEDDEICKEYASKDERIIYIKHEENKKQGGARNTGIKAATGKYITFVDSDDYLENTTGYEAIINFMERKKIQLVIFDVIILEENGEKSYINTVCKGLIKKGKINPYKWTPVMSSVCNKVMVLDDLKNNKIYFEENLKFEDLPYSYKYLIATNPTVYYFKNGLYVYRMNNLSTTQVNSKNDCEKSSK